MKDLAKKMILFVIIGFIVMSIFKLLGNIFGIKDFDIGWFAGIVTTLIMKSYEYNA